MDWISLHLNEHWKALWESEEIRDLLDTNRRTLVHTQLDPERRGVVRGQLMALERLPLLVAQLAEHQQKRADKAAEESAAASGNVSALRRFRDKLPKVY